MCTNYAVAIKKSLLTVSYLHVESNKILWSTIFTNAVQTFHPVDLQGGRFFYLIILVLIHIIQHASMHFILFIVCDLLTHWNYVYYLLSIQKSEQIVYWLIIQLKLKFWHKSERLIYPPNLCVMCSFGTSWKSSCLYSIDWEQIRNQKTGSCPPLQKIHSMIAWTITK